jgi:Polyketide synthase modules and related proteins
MTEIAIVGMGAVFPGAGDAATYWRNICAGVDAITDVPAHRWDPACYYDADSYAGPAVSDRFYCRRGGFIDELATFDPTRFGIMPTAVEGAEPDQLLALRTAAEAITDAGGDERLPDRARIGVIVGRGGYITPGVARFDQRVRTSHQLVSVLAELVPDLSKEQLCAVRTAFCEKLGPHRPDTVIGLVPNFAASRIANRFDLRGPAYTVDAACASSLIAVEHAVRALADGRCDAVLAGAVHHSHHATLWSVFSQLRALSPTQRIRPFDRRADGTLLSEGTGIVLLKRLVDAERDGDRIYAVIRGVGTSSDGRASSLMSPLADGQVLAVERAWADAGLDPRAPGALGLLEAHGTATPTGDEVELETLRRVFGDGSGSPIGLGTVKSMIGHAMPASGMAGLIKTAFALHAGVRPPTLHVEEPHPALVATRFRPVTELEEWERIDGTPRRAAVNAFGFGGINAHVVLEEPPGQRAHRRRSLRRQTRHGREGVLLLCADTVEELVARLRDDGDALIARAGDGAVLDGGPCRLAIVAPDPHRLELARKIVARGTPWRGRSDIWFTREPLLAGGAKVAFLFPGFEPVFEPRVDDVADHFGLPRPDLTGSTELVPHASDVIAVGRLLTRALRELGIEPDLATGHSLGEWTAMIVAGMYPPEAMDTFIGSLVRDGLDVPDLAYAALGLGAVEAAEVIAGVDEVVVSHDNCPHQSVICGRPDRVREVLDRLRADGLIAQELPFRSGFHSPMMAAYLAPVRTAFRTLSIQSPAFPVWSATSKAPFPDDPDEVRALVVRHLLEPVRFRALTMRLYDAGVRAFVQVGPGSITGFVEDTLRDRPHLAIAANTPKHTGMAQLCRIAAALWVEGRGPRVAPAPIPTPAANGHALRLDLGTPLVRLDGAVPPLTLPGLSWVPGVGAPQDMADSPVLAEFAALLRDTTAVARTVLDAAEAKLMTAPTERVTTRVFSLAEMPYVRDHCLMPQPAGWPEESDRFPVVPLTTLLEVMAEAARELCSGVTVTGFESVRALRWVVAAPPTTVTVRTRRDGPGRVTVTLEGYTSGVVLIADRHPVPPRPDTTSLTGERAPAVNARQFYAERWMFHGPRYAGVREIAALAEDGLRGELTVLPSPGALLDSAGQLLGHWIQVYGEVDQTVFPVGIDRVTLYGPLPPVGARLAITVRNRSLSDTTSRGDAELVTSDGRVWARIEGWTTHRFYTDEFVWQMKLLPELSGIGEPQPGGWCLARERWRGTASRDLLMRQYLGAAERAEYERLTPRAQGPWLLGRIAAKDAVRHWLWERGHGPLFPVEIGVHNDAQGRPVVTGPFTEPFAVSIAHTAGLAAAIVRPADQGVGIDIEAVADRGQAVEGVALTTAERVLLDQLCQDGTADRATWLTRFWTAKAAVAKAAGTGLRGRPRDFAVAGVDGDRLLVTGGACLETAVRDAPQGHSASRTDGFQARPNGVTSVGTRLLDGHIVAWIAPPVHISREKPE